MADPRELRWSTASAQTRPAWPVAVDVGMAVVLAVFVAGVTTGLSYDDPAARGADLLMYAVIGVGALSLSFRRVAPVTVLVITTACLSIYVASGYTGGPLYIIPLFALYNAGMSRSGRDLGWLVALTAVPTMAAYLLSGRAAGTAWTVVAFLIYPAAAAFVVVVAARNRRDQMRAVRQRAIDLETNQQAEARRQVAEERLRIARDIHDTVAHSLASISLLAGAGARIAEDDPTAARRALEDIRRASTEALADVRATIGGLRDADSIAPGADGVDRLVEQVRAAGLDVSAEVSVDLTETSQEVRTATYRIVQESMTNVLRHSGSSTADLAICDSDGGIEIVVRDLGRGPTAGATEGHGLTGMRERARSVGGRLDAAARPEGGFEVRAWLPLVAASGGGS